MGYLLAGYRIDVTAMESSWPNPMITVSSNNQTIGVILVFIRHPLIGFVCRQTDMYTVYIKAGQNASDSLIRNWPAPASVDILYNVRRESFRRFGGKRKP